MVKRQHPIVKTDCQVGNLKLVEPRPGQSFQMMAKIIAKHAGGAALEWRKVLNPFRSISGHSLGQHGKRIRIPPHPTLSPPGRGWGEGAPGLTR